MRVAGGRLLILRGHREPVASVRFSADGRFVATASRDHKARIWDAATGTRLHTVGHAARVQDAAFSPNGRWLVTAGPASVGVWDTTTGGRPFLPLGPTAPQTAAWFTSDGRTIVATGEDGALRTYDCWACSSAAALEERAERLLGTLSS
jgi:WD40 repeat protein